MKFITDNNTLLTFIPNVITHVEGEDDLLTKLTPWLTAEEMYFEDSFLKYEVISEMEKATDILIFARMAIVNRAFAAAIPSLDLILTGNGFGIVSNQTIAPASRDRVNALVGSLIDSADAAIESIAVMTNGAILGQSIFRGFEAQRMLGKTTKLYQEYLATINAVRREEHDLGATIISAEVLKQLHQSAYHTGIEIAALAQLQFLCKMFVLNRLQDKPVHGIRTSIVEHIRQNADSFPNWATSEAAKYWQDTRFKNDKKTGGFWM